MKNCIFILLMFFVACNQSGTTSSRVADTLQTEKLAVADSRFSGGYLIGDGVWYITPVSDGYEMRTSPQGVISYVLFFEGVEEDSLYVYTTKDQTIFFKLNPTHKSGMYYENDEAWPVRSFAEQQETIEEKS